MTFKRGAGPGSMTFDEDLCRQTSTDEAAYAACLRERGWFVAGKAAKADVETAPAEGVGAAPEAAPVETAPPVVTKQVPVATTAPAIKASAASASTTPAAAAPAPASASAAAATSKTTGSPAPTTAVTDTAPSKPKAVDPLTRVDVASWWKLGGTAADLDRAMVKCADELGPAYRPDPGSTIVTVGLRDCLRKAKWFPLGHSLGK